MHTILKEREFLDKHCTHTEKLMQGRTRTDMSLQEQVKADLTCITPQMASPQGNPGSLEGLGFLHA